MGSTATISVFVLLILLGIMAFAVVWAVFFIISVWKLFEKAGVEGWKSLIPYYSCLKLSEIATGRMTLGIIQCVVSVIYGMVSFYFNCAGTSGDVSSVIVVRLFTMAIYILAGIMYFKLAKSFGKSDGWSVAMMFLYPILIIALGYDNALQYVGPNGVSSSDQFSVDNYDNNNNY